MRLGRRAFVAGGAAAIALETGAIARRTSKTSSRPFWVKLPTEHYHGKQDDIFFLNPDVGWYGNGAGKVFKTVDGGLNWTKVFEKAGTFVRAIGFIDAQTGFFGNIGTGYFPGVTDEQPLYRTDDGGLTWEPVRNVSGPTPKGICAIDVQHIPFINAGHLDERIIVRAGGRVGSPAFLLESRNRGTSWLTRDMGGHTAMILDVKFVSERAGFIAGATDPELEQSRALVLRTLDAGKTWHPVYRSARPWEVTWKLAFPTPRVGYATIQNYNADTANVRRVVAKTVDGGTSWRELHLTDDHEVNELGIGFLDEQRGWVGSTTTGFETVDGGEHWTRADIGKAVNKIRILKSPHGRAVAFAIGTDVYKLEI